MKNIDKYRDEIISGIKNKNLWDFYETYIRPIYNTPSKAHLRDQYLGVIFALWLNEEYQEPEPDWSKVKTDDLVRVRDIKGESWENRHFAKYEDGTVYVWVGGMTSFTANGRKESWKYAKLAEREETV